MGIHLIARLFLFCLERSRLSLKESHQSALLVKQFLSKVQELQLAHLIDQHQGSYSGQFIAPLNEFIDLQSLFSFLESWDESGQLKLLCFESLSY